MNIFTKIQLWIAKVLNKLGIIRSITLVKEIDCRQVRVFLDNDNTITMLKKDWELLISTDEGKELREYIRDNDDIRLNLKEGDDIQWKVIIMYLKSDIIGIRMI